VPLGHHAGQPLLGHHRHRHAHRHERADYIKALAGNDKISGGAGEDTTDGGGGNDTYSYGYGWGTDTLIDSGGTADHLNLSALGAVGMYVFMVPEAGYGVVVQAGGPGGTISQVNLPSGGGIEKVTGSAAGDYIETGGAANTLRPGPGTGGADFVDHGGDNVNGVSIPASSDTYSGFAAGGYGEVPITDCGGTADKLVLPFASTDAYFEAYGSDEDAALDDLLIMTSATDWVYIRGQLDPKYFQKGRIEQLVFTDETITIDTETQAQTLSGAKTTGSAEAQVAALNEASNLDEAEKAKRSEAAKKAIEEAKHQEEGQHRPNGGQQR
jgi:hypothetical protein